MSIESTQESPCKLITFPVDRTKRQQEINQQTEADELINEFVSTCFIVDDDEQASRYITLRNKIFAYVDKKRGAAL